MNLVNLQKYELTGTNIKQILGDNIKIVFYPDLKKYKNIMDVFDDEGRCVLFLVEQEINNSYNGHYECLIYHKDTNTIEFFDSYGLSPLGWNKFIAKSLQKKLHEVSGTMLMPLLEKAKNDGYNIIYNHIKLQQMKNNINTCGDYVSTRLLYKNLSIQQYIGLLDKLKTHYDVKTYDEAVAIYINGIIEK